MKTPTIKLVSYLLYLEIINILLYLAVTQDHNSVLSSLICKLISTKLLLGLQCLHSFINGNSTLKIYNYFVLFGRLILFS